VAVSTEQFKAVMRRWASGITIVTTRREGGIHGMTANAFCGVSLDPPLILVCVERQTHTHDLIAEQQAFGVHFLAADQKEFSNLCAGFSGETGHWLESLAYRVEQTGAPILDGFPDWLDCRLWASYDGGDHAIYVGLVEAAGAGAVEPLLWFDRGYRWIAAESLPDSDSV
jgi:flavin reductase (DIM6/NTAB) family NADH-FMN oxidoreductase RutF